jgi:hypothetical protein
MIRGGMGKLRLLAEFLMSVQAAAPVRSFVMTSLPTHEERAEEFATITSEEI